jgi:hypothetical protein
VNKNKKKKIDNQQLNFKNGVIEDNSALNFMDFYIQKIEDYYNTQRLI